ncbi:MAG: CRISPR-associated endonuclease Cas3'' [Variovorax sp.]
MHGEYQESRSDPSHRPVASPSTDFYAHSLPGQPHAQWQKLSDHLLQTGSTAAGFASVFKAAALAQTQGRLHDLGKYTHEFQQRLNGSELRVDHSSWGARIAAERFLPLGQLLAYGIAGHHAGLANGRDPGERTALCDRLTAELPGLQKQWESEIPLLTKLELPVDFKTYGTSKAQAQERAQFQLSFLTRMLFSCLVDADFQDTESFYLRAEDKPPSQRSREVPSLGALQAHLNGFLSSSFTANTPVNALRADILRHVRSEAGHKPGLFSLTVPTGGGKTLASLAFALDHALRHGLRRVIFVIPFTSIVEQTAAVFRRALGELGERAVLEHHSAFIEQAPPSADPEKYQAVEKLRLAMENWDAPIVVTTAVQFFESLFAARPSQCRKLHNIAGSVVILDEAQTMPLKLLRPCVATIDELARNYRCSMVLCTATQPALEAPNFDQGLQCVHELAPDKDELFRQLERVRVRQLGLLSDDALAAHLRQREQVLCIVNNRRQARAIYQRMADLPGARHLTTLMCAKHRSQVLGEVRRLLLDGQPCRLVSTSLIEAGVDVDFPTVLRAEAGLDSLAQAAGRCNREGKRDVQVSELLVFGVNEDDWPPPPELKQLAQVAREVLRLHPDDPLSPAAIRRYFESLYWQKGENELDAHDLMGMLRRSRPDSLPMETLASKFRMIDSVQMPVIVPFDEEARGLLKQLRFAEGSGGLARKLQSYLVQLPRQGFEALRKVGAIQPVLPEKWGEQFMELVHEKLYDSRFGLSWDDPTFIGSSDLVR